jgi:TRAP-type C4-dicarboxylate transport system permease small subunit
MPEGSTLSRLMTAVSRLAAAAAASILILMLAHTVVEIVLRVVFSTSTQILEEFVGYGLGAMTMLALAQTFRDGQIIRVNLLLPRLPERVRRPLEVVCVLATIVLMTFVAWTFWLFAARNFTRGFVSETVAEVPLWIPPGIMLMGMAILLLQLVFYLVALLRGGPYIVEGQTDV